MHITKSTILFLLVSMLSACNQNGVANDTDSNVSSSYSNIECAALISGATELMLKRRVAHDAEFESAALYSMMTHLNSHAIPRGLSEAEAFRLLKKTKRNLSADLDNSEVMVRAKLCMKNLPSN